LIPSRELCRVRKPSDTPPYVTIDTLPDKARAWSEQIAKYNRHTLKLVAERAALLVVDMQRFFLDPDGIAFSRGGPAVVPNCRRLLDAFRAARRPVLFTAYCHRGDDLGILEGWWAAVCREGSAEAEITPDLLPLPTERVIVKRRYSAFYGTDLEVTLRDQGITDLVVCGVNTNVCVESTVRDAFSRDFRCFTLLDATGTVDEPLHLASLRNLAFGCSYVVATDDVIRWLQPPAGA